MIVTTNDLLVFTNQESISNESQATESIRQAIAYAESKCDRKLSVVGNNPISDSWQFDGHGGLRLYTPNAPIQDVIKVETWNGSSWEEIDTVTHTVTIDGEGDYIFFREQYPWTVGMSNWRVTYTFGFTSLPADLKRAILLVAHSFMKISTRSADIKSQSDGEQTIVYNDPSTISTTNAESEATFMRYRRWR